MTVAERQAERVDLTGRVAVGEAHRLPGGDGAEQRDQVRGTRQRGELGDRSALGHRAAELPERLDAARTLEPHGGRGEMQRRELVRLELGVGQVVLVARDAVADDVGVVGVGEPRRDGYPHVAERLLVALEGPPKRVAVVGVAGHAFVDLVRREQPIGVEQRGSSGWRPAEWARRCLPIPGPKRTTPR